MHGNTIEENADRAGQSCLGWTFNRCGKNFLNSEASKLHSKSMQFDSQSLQPATNCMLIVGQLAITRRTCVRGKAIGFVCLLSVVCCRHKNRQIQSFRHSCELQVASLHQQSPKTVLPLPLGAGYQPRWLQILHLCLPRPLITPTLGSIKAQRCRWRKNGETVAQLHASSQYSKSRYNIDRSSFSLIIDPVRDSSESCECETYVRNPLTGGIPLIYLPLSILHMLLYYST